MYVYPSNSSSNEIKPIIVIVEILVVTFACFIIHHIGKLFFQYLYKDIYNKLSDVDKRCAQAEFTSTVLTLTLIPMFITGCFETYYNVYE
jgi:hypothetical protein